MKNYKIALIACSNGHGHVRRLSFLAKFLSNYKIKVDLYAEMNKVLKFLNIENLNNINLINFDSKTTEKDFKLGKQKTWLHLINKVDNYDLVISDNLVDILEIRPDAVIMASFFWHDILKNISNEYVINSKNLLKKYKPTIIGSKIFSCNSVKRNLNFFGTGLFINNEKKINSTIKKTDLLLSYGWGGNSILKFKKIIKKIQNPYPFNTIWLEPSLYNSNMPSFFMPANYEPSMYQKLICSVIRPGLGTIAECLNFNVKVFALEDNNNKEIKHNSKQLKKYKVGEYFNNLNDALLAATKYAKDSKRYIFFNNEIKKIDFDGLKQTSDLIFKMLDIKKLL